MVSVSVVQAGTSYNVIPESATIAGTYRAFGWKGFRDLRERLEEVTNRCSSKTLLRFKKLKEETNITLFSCKC